MFDTGSESPVSSDAAVTPMNEAKRLERMARLIVPALLASEEFYADDIVAGIEGPAGFGKRALWEAMELAAQDHGVRFVKRKGGGYVRAGPERRFQRSVTRYRAGLRIFKRQEKELQRIAGAVAGAAKQLEKVQELIVRSRARLRLESKKKPKGL